ncbi:MAG: PAS domain-containing protein, partial [Bacteroidota bacterium]
QGANTTDASRAYVRQQLNSGQSFTAEIINYRKNQEEYLCEVNVYPLTDNNGQTTHYFALEKKIA